MSVTGAQAPAATPPKTWVVWTGRLVSVMPVYILFTAAEAERSSKLSGRAGFGCGVMIGKPFPETVGLLESLIAAKGRRG